MNPESESEFADRREGPRLDIRLPVRLEHGDGWTRDVSSSGIYFETTEPLTEGAAIRFSVVLEHVFPAPLRLECEGQIVRVERREGKLGVAAALNSYRLIPQEQHPELRTEQPDLPAGSPCNTCEKEKGVQT